MNLMQFLKALVWILSMAGMVGTGTLIALGLLDVYHTPAILRYAPLLIGGAGCMCILAFVGLVVMFRRR